MPSASHSLAQLFLCDQANRVCQQTPDWPLGIEQGNARSTSHHSGDVHSKSAGAGRSDRQPEGSQSSGAVGTPGLKSHSDSTSGPDRLPGYALY